MERRANEYREKEKNEIATSIVNDWMRKNWGKKVQLRWDNEKTCRFTKKCAQIVSIPLNLVSRVTVEQEYRWKMSISVNAVV